MVNFNLDYKKSFLSSIFVTNCAIWFKKDLSKELKKSESSLPIEFEWDSTDRTIEWLKNQQISWLVHPKETTTALEYNHYWPSAILDGEIIGCIKVGFKNVYISDYGKLVRFPEKMAFIYDTYVLEKYRCKGVAKFLISQVAIHLKSEGFTSLGCHIPAWNKSSIKAFEKNGFKKVKYIRNFMIFGIPIRISNSSDKSSIFNGGKITYEELPY